MSGAAHDLRAAGVRGYFESERAMTIKVAPYGYAGTVTMGGGVMLINGVLHEAVRPVNRGDILWVPVRSHTGLVEEVDDRGRPLPVTATPAPEVSA